MCIVNIHAEMKMEYCSTGTIIAYWYEFGYFMIIVHARSNMLKLFDMYLLFKN